jgi:predicted nucleic-acid-binding protein
MIGLDTNVLLRLGDNLEPAQRGRALALIRSQGFGGCFVNGIVLCEFSWTLRQSYKMTRSEIAARLAVLLELPELVIASPEEAARALQRFRVGPAEFADYFLAEINRSAGCASTATFDSDAIKSGEPFVPVPELS